MLLHARTPFRTSLYLALADLIHFIARAVRRGIAQPALFVHALYSSNMFTRVAVRRRRHLRGQRPARLRRLPKRGLRG